MHTSDVRAMWRSDLSATSPRLGQYGAEPGVRPGYYVWGGLSPGHRECGSASIYWGLGAEPPMGVQGHSPGEGSGGKAPLKLKFDTFACFIETLMFISRKFGGAEFVVFGGAKLATWGGLALPNPTLSSPLGAKDCDGCVCLSACSFLSVHLHIPETTWRLNFTKF